MSRTIDIETDISARELEARIEDAPSGATLRFAAGDYTFDDAITLRRSDISLIGAGVDRTTFTFSDEALENDDFAIRLAGGRGETIGTLDTHADEGDRQVRLEHAPDTLAVGDTVRLWQDNDDDFFDDIGDTSWRKVDHAELRTSMARVEAIDGRDLTLDRGVHFDLDGDDTHVERIDTVDDVSLEGFTLDFELGRPEAGEFDNTLDALSRYHAVLLDGTVNASVDEIRVVDGPSTAFRFSRVLDSDVDNIEAHGSFNKGGGGNGYAYELHESYDGDFTGLIDSGMRHGLVFASWRSSVGNEVHVESTDRDVNFHGGRDHDNRVHVAQSIRDPETDDLSTTLWVNAGGEHFGAITDPDANQVRFDYVVGSRRDDHLQGSDDGVYLDGGLGHDTLTGGDGDDILQGGPGDDGYDGDDHIDGGDGRDSVLYMADRDAYTIDFDDDTLRVTGEGGTDTLEHVEELVFADGTHLDVASRESEQGDPAEVPSVDDILAADAHHSDAADLALSGDVTSAWSSGYVAQLFVENRSDEVIETPELHFTLADDIDVVWNGEFTRDGEDYRVHDDDQRTLQPGETWRFAYRAYGEDRSIPDSPSAQTADGDDLAVALTGIDTGRFDMLDG
ncbi:MULTISPECIES: cellulose binding domain-containing protein [unclassified Modicisalibacter]|uniref:cellulose binding domain-containing protein n=1 Tax=unclassified Modicisalibacter TaxID=2679913 RepID=UPI001D856ACA|nr:MULTISPECIES: cellulose binding domain-containing protein [unclassified Modicisalibacter]MBZ9560043.1 cellulose binding domain-containing protein [Modicisalibacter sp. R2A 31.J]MBZ9575952.1 cellulose binding domain-containing protein [Modicisalibacter sp. MOD 31.J]